MDKSLYEEIKNKNKIKKRYTESRKTEIYLKIETIPLHTACINFSLQTYLNELKQN